VFHLFKYLCIIYLQREENIPVKQRKRILENEWNQICGILEKHYNVPKTQNNDPYIKKILEILKKQTQNQTKE